MHALEVKDLQVAYDKKAVLEHVNVIVPKGSLTAIVGPNGAGKSTLIKAILGMLKRSSGHISVLGKPYSPKNRNVGYVPQRGSVDWDFPTNSLDVVLMGRYAHIGWFKRPSKQDVLLAKEALQKLGMESYATRQIRQLSGGQQQRVFLARALVQDADVYFMDEPFVGVDAKTENAIIDLLRELQQKGKTVIVVHHDLQTVPEYFDRTLLLNRTVIANGPTEHVFTKDLLQKTYGGALAFFTAPGDRISG
ncbi:metal ABC transporter ATP-binding protein [Terribacillus sp. DMT04]|uniref:metal ABC transporter ATP-binding protein n=1 Tax=Terribacillus sp. DMT04 TaxID=2850441 RepID=UPI001C2BF8BE|nr:metal ABC transporter ATP-binding protein [Terribacillus sp. DMT04]QXE02749.1 metal ABC transporter ATP-binding protein [Terribacillus sp. DMT04]